MKESMKPGIEYTLDFKVTENKTVPKLYPESELFREMPEVFATGFMVGLMEWACMEALHPHLDEGESSVGISINVSHESATPVGMGVKVHAKCIGVDGLKTKWQIEAFDERDCIGRGTHERFSINLEKFHKGLAKKQG